MRVGVLSYPMLFQTGGGLKMKLSRTVEALQKRGIEARLADPVRERLTEYDLIHLFAPYNGNHRVVEQAKSDGLPVVMSTILNPPFTRWDGIRARLLSRLTSRLTSWTISTSYQQVQTALAMADHLVVLGSIERNMLIDGYLMPPEKITVIHNGIGEEFFSASPQAFEAAHAIPHPFVLHTGIVNDVKNQLGLVRALKNEDVHIVMVGYAGKGNEEYLAACLKEGGGKVHYLGELPHGPLIASAYAAADVVAIPSRHEGMPNSILEGLASDKPVVLTDNHTMDFTLPKDVAREVAPDDHEAIRKAVMGFLNDRPAPGRARAVVAQMSWGAVAEQLERIYLSLMPRELPPPGTEPATQHGQFGRQRQP